jgi:hypothetical protein
MEMGQLLVHAVADGRAWPRLSIVSAENLEQWSRPTMNEARALKVGMIYHSIRSGRTLTVTAIEDNRVYYEVEGFATASPLFLDKNKFMHLVGLDSKDRE